MNGRSPRWLKKAANAKYYQTTITHIQNEMILETSTINNDVVWVNTKHDHFLNLAQYYHYSESKKVRKLNPWFEGMVALAGWHHQSILATMLGPHPHDSLW